MTPEIAVSIATQAVWVLISMVCVLILPSLLVGLFVAIIQAVTQVNEQTLSFFPRLLTTILSVIIFGHWLLMKITGFFEYIFFTIPNMVQ